MKNQKWIVFSAALVLMAATALALTWFRANQKLGQPGIIAAAIPGEKLKMKINLPERVLDFTSTNVPEAQVVLNYLPADTSFAERIYTAPDGFQVQGTIILMGADRTSIHNADFCLTGQAFSGKEKSVAEIPIGGAKPYQMPVARWNVAGTFQNAGGQKTEVHGVYVFWFVADGEETPGHFEFMKRQTLHFLRTGVLERWAYVSYFALCAPGREAATFERMKDLIAGSVPEYQLPTGGR